MFFPFEEAFNSFIVFQLQLHQTIFFFLFRLSSLLLLCQQLFFFRKYFFFNCSFFSLFFSYLLFFNFFFPLASIWGPNLLNTFNVFVQPVVDVYLLFLKLLLRQKSKLHLPFYPVILLPFGLTHLTSTSECCHSHCLGQPAHYKFFQTCQHCKLNQGLY